MKPINADLPYPDFSSLTADPVAARIIAPAYASSASELGAILQYLYHHFVFTELGNEEYATKLEEISLSEMHHLDILGNLLFKLGSDPVFTACPPVRKNFFCTNNISYANTPLRMLSDDLGGEVKALCMYREMAARLKNPVVSAVILRIAADEELHIKVLSEMIAGLKNC